MTVIILTQNQVEQVCAVNGSGQHQLSPMPLTDGRYFLPADILSEIGEGGIYEGRLCADCPAVPLSSIAHLMPQPEESV
jgi:hypothetical protein